MRREKRKTDCLLDATCFPGYLNVTRASVSVHFWREQAFLPSPSRLCITARIRGKGRTDIRGGGEGDTERPSDTKPCLADCQSLRCQCSNSSCVVFSSFVAP